jgi:hypothetical protein
MSEQDGGGGWIRTNVGVRQRIYSPSPLATRAPLRRAEVWPERGRVNDRPARRIHRRWIRWPASGRALSQQL